MKNETKKILSFLLGVSMLSSITACTNPNDDSSKLTNSEIIAQIDPAEHDLSAFDLAKYTAPVWAGNVSYAEGAFVRQNAEGVVEPIQLLYPIEKIVSVRSADLKTVYEEGKDYRVTADGKLEILTGGAIPVLTYDKYYFPTYTDDGLQSQIPAASGVGAYIVAETTHSSPGMSAWCLAVTYAHTSESIVTVPQDRSEKFVKLNEKLANGEDIKVAYYGDSITVGWAATAMESVNRAPYCPTYCDLAMDWLENKYDSQITRVNLAKSGETTVWGKEYSNYKKVCDENPDLVILAFGMNDGGAYAPETFVANIKNIVSNITKRCPDVEIAVVSPMLPNSQVGFSSGSSLLNYHTQYPAALAEEEEEWENAGVVNVTQAHQQLLTRKVFQDTTSSNTNHPNDYMHRVYAQVLLRALVGNEYK